MRHQVISILFCALQLTACAANNKSDWEGMDYAKIARENYRRENDSGYVAPSVNGCVDDDLYNCSGRGAYR